MRIRKRNNVIYWFGFCIFFVPLILFIIPFIFNNDGASFVDSTNINNYFNFFANLYDFGEEYGDLGIINFGYVIRYILSLPLFSWIQSFVNYLLVDIDVNASAFGQIFYCFIAWVLIYNEIWLFIRVFLWFFDIPNEILERSVNIV